MVMLVRRHGFPNPLYQYKAQIVPIGWFTSPFLHISNGFLSTIFRPHTFDPALLRCGRLDRKFEFGFLT